MPSKKTAPKKAAPAAAPEPAEAAATDGATGEPADGPAEDADAQPLNRAERRAKGKSATASQPTFRGKVVGGHGPANTQRMWSNRRSGG